MEIYETNCIVLSHDILSQSFGQLFWNDTEDIRCIPTKKLSEEQWKKLEKFKLDVDKLKKAEYIISEYWGENY
jgi:hypothetical protein